jgi:hypothetical protein
MSRKQTACCERADKRMVQQNLCFGKDSELISRVQSIGDYGCTLPSGALSRKRGSCESKAVFVRRKLKKGRACRT